MSVHRRESFRAAPSRGINAVAVFAENDVIGVAIEADERTADEQEHNQTGATAWTHDSIPQGIVPHEKADQYTGRRWTAGYFRADENVCLMMCEFDDR